MLTLCAGLLLGNMASARETLVLAHPYAKEAVYAARVVSLICSDAFHQLGMDVEVRILPPLRGSIEADAGNIDGEVGRGYGYGNKHPNLARVEESLLNVRVAAFTRTPGLKVDGWASLKGSSYRVEYRSGYINYKARLEEQLPPAQISAVIDSNTGLQHVAQGRTDIYIDVEEFGELQIARLPKRYSEVYNAGLVQNSPIYIYLHKRHAALALRLAEVVSKMKSSGAINRHIATALGEERNGAP